MSKLRNKSSSPDSRIVTEVPGFFRILSDTPSFFIPLLVLISLISYLFLSMPNDDDTEGYRSLTTSNIVEIMMAAKEYAQTYDDELSVDNLVEATLLSPQIASQYADKSLDIFQNGQLITLVLNELTPDTCKYLKERLSPYTDTTCVNGTLRLSAPIG